MLNKKLNVRCLYLQYKLLGTSGRNYSKRISPNEFGNIGTTDVRLEKLVRPESFSRMDESVEKRKQKKVISVPLAGFSKAHIARIAREQEPRERSAKNNLLIESSRQEFNQPLNYIPRRGTYIPLTSQFWDKGKYKNNWFTIHRQCKNVASTSSGFASWEDYVPDKLSAEVFESLKRMRAYEPFGVQSQCLQSFSSKNHLFIAAETGSGKTIAFAAPLLSWVHRNRKNNCKEKAIVLVATNALKNQIFEVFQEIALGTLARVASCDTVKDENWDILIGTPGLMEKALRSSSNPSDVKQIVIDEADMLLDEGFTDVLTEIFSLVPVAHSEANITGHRDKGARITFCSASCPEDLECIAECVVDRSSLSYIRSDNLHHLLKNIKMTFIRIRERDKIDTLVNLLNKDINFGEHNQTAIFCKDKKTVHFVYDTLVELKLNPVLWNGQITEEALENHRILVASDAASRGLDLPRLSHVINYDMARHAVDFLHRIGRVGRLSSRFPGKVTSFVRTVYEVKLTQKIELAARLHRGLNNIETDVTAKINQKKKKEDPEKE